jgi:nicotinamidase-related amidase
VRATQRGTVVVVGCETDVCVAQSAIRLQAAGFACVVVEDATFSPGEMHERGLTRVTSEGIGRDQAKGVTYEWLRTVADARDVLRDSSLPLPPFQL